MGLIGCATSDIILDHVFVPEEDRLGEENMGFVNAMKTLDVGRMGVAAQAIGVAAGSLEDAIALIKEKKNSLRVRHLPWHGWLPAWKRPGSLYTGQHGSRIHVMIPKLPQWPPPWPSFLLQKPAAGSALRLSVSAHWKELPGALNLRGVSGTAGYLPLRRHFPGSGNGYIGAAAGVKISLDLE